MTTDVMTSDTFHRQRHHVEEADGTDAPEDPGASEEPEERDETPEARRTEQVRIIGAERAADAVAQSPGAGSPGAPIERAGEPDASGAEASSGEEWGADDSAVPAEPPMLHWTEAPTGEVPAVLSRGDETGDDPWASLPEPTWREERHDWEQEEPIAPSLLGAAGEEPSLITESAEEERQPWSFDLDVPAARAPEPEDTDDLEELGDLATEDLFGAWSSADVSIRDRVADRSERELEDFEELEELETEAELAALEEVRDDLAAGGHAGGFLEADDAGDAGQATVREDLGEKTSVLHLGAAARNRPAPRTEPGKLPGTRPREEAERAGHAPRPHVRREPVAHRAGDDALSQRTGRNIPAAVATGIIIGGLALLAFHFGTVPSMVVVTAVITAASIEAFAAFRHAYRPATLLGIVAVAGVIVGSYDKPFVALPAVTVLLVAATFLWQLVGVDRRADPVRSTAATLLVFCWVGVFGSYAAILLAPSLFPNRTGIAYLLGALIAAVAYDVGALVVGAWLGRHPLSHASPGKTWEGVLGGAVAAIVFAVAIVHLIHPWTLAETAVLGVVVAIVSPIGDLCESLVKRHLGLKDMGRILPGHGGLLDRVDGLLFVLPATYYLIRAFGHG